LEFHFLAQLVSQAVHTRTLAILPTTAVITVGLTVQNGEESMECVTAMAVLRKKHQNSQDL
jgi:hypothetical protein